MRLRKLLVFAVSFIFLLAAFSACTKEEDDPNAPQIAICGDGIDGEIVYTKNKMEKIQNAMFEHEYSAVNNYPTKKIYSASGIKISALLEDAGVLDTAKVITFEANDGYSVSITAEQLLNSERYFFPGIMEDNSENAEKVESIIAFKSGESSDLSSMEECSFSLFFGQELITEHTTPAFIENISKITISSDEPERWEKAGVFPAAGIIDAGETVKLQHDSLGAVKIYYTLDGTDPTMESAMYNPSTYQPELNAPIPITENTVIKAIAIGYGKNDSEIAEFEFNIR